MRRTIFVEQHPYSTRNTILNMLEMYVYNILQF